MKSAFVISFLLLAGLPLYATKDLPKYPVSLIAEELKKDVDVVVRRDEVVYTIHSQSRASQYVFFAATIFTSNASEYTQQFVYYDKLSKISSLKANIYDADGTLVKKLKASDFIDHAAVDGFTLYSDNRLKFIDLRYHAFPFTIEIEYELQHNFQFYIPTFGIQTDERVSVEYSEFRLVYPTTLRPKFKCYNVEGEPVRSTLANDTESTSWKFTNLKPITFEAFSLPSSQIKFIAAAPTVFEFEGYEGTMGSWNEFGAWINTLNQGRNVLPDPTKAHLISITKDIPTREGKVKAVYQYLQNRTRYVGIQLGIGGYQPFDATTVDKTGYGDCKALSNYMVSMLNAIDIKAHYVLVQAGRNNTRLDASFPSSQFNHAIVCVPNGRDTLWLECTSQNNPFGYMGTFTGDRKALAITDNGASIVSTPKYSEKENVQSRSAFVKVMPDGNASATVKTSYKGIQYENDHLSNSLENYDDQKKWILENTEIPTFDLTSFTVNNQKDKIPVATIEMTLKLNRYCTVNDKRVFLTPNLMNRSTTSVPKIENRKNPVYLKMSFTDYDTIRYEIPDELYPEFVPAPVAIKSQFGEYESSYTLEQGKLVYTRKLMRRNGVFPANSYQDLSDFYKQINKADNAKIVLLNKT
jgi:hypothetical protein